MISIDKRVGRLARAFFTRYCNFYNIDIEYASDNTFYFDGEKSLIHLGDSDGFKKCETFEPIYKALHELSHSTMLQTNRLDLDYSLEEAVANTINNYLCNKLKIFENAFINDLSKKTDTLLFDATYTISWFQAYAKTDDLEELKAKINLVKNYVQEAIEKAILPAWEEFNE